MIYENFLFRVDEEGRRKIIMDKIIDHQREEISISKEQGDFTTASVLLWKKRTTMGWEICAQWKYGSTDWKP